MDYDSRVICTQSDIAIELTIEPVNSSCDANATYQISWVSYQYSMVKSELSMCLKQD